MNPSICTADDLPERLERLLRSWRCDESARRKMAPSLSYGRQAGPPATDARCGAVVILLNRRSGAWHFPLTIRPKSVPRHGGQICLPGGLAELSETSKATAARELTEELGAQEGIRWLGAFAEFFVYVSNVRVIPWIAVVDDPPIWCPDPREVAAVIDFPLLSLVEPTAIGEMNVDYGPLRLRAPCFQYHGHSIWGATAMMLSELASLLRASNGCAGFSS